MTYGNIPLLKEQLNIYGIVCLRVLLKVHF